MFEMCGKKNGNSFVGKANRSVRWRKSPLIFTKGWWRFERILKCKILGKQHYRRESETVLESIWILLTNNGTASILDILDDKSGIVKAVKNGRWLAGNACDTCMKSTDYCMYVWNRCQIAWKPWCTNIIRMKQFGSWVTHQLLKFRAANKGLLVQRDVWWCLESRHWIFRSTQADTNSPGSNISRNHTMGTDLRTIVGETAEFLVIQND